MANVLIVLACLFQELSKFHVYGKCPVNIWENFLFNSLSVFLACFASIIGYYGIIWRNFNLFSFLHNKEKTYWMLKYQHFCKGHRGIQLILIKCVCVCGCVCVFGYVVGCLHTWVHMCVCVCVCLHGFVPAYG